MFSTLEVRESGTYEAAEEKTNTIHDPSWNYSYVGDRRLCGIDFHSGNSLLESACVVFEWRGLRHLIFMIPFFLYFVAGLVTGFHVYTLLALAVLGVPINPLEFVSLLGSLCLLIAAYVSLFKPDAAAKLALIAALAMWSFYGPAIAKSVRTIVDRHNVASNFAGSSSKPR